MSVTVRAAARLAAVVLLATSLAACGSDETTTATDGASTATPTESSPTSTTTATPGEPAGPDCATTWQDGAELPRVYAGCVDESGALVPADKIGCSSGQVLLTYDTWWGVAGGTVHEGTAPLTDDDGFMAAVRRCRA